MEIIRIPYGENPYLGDEQRKRTLEGYKDKPEFITRYVKGEFSSVHLGEEVLPEFSELHHRSRWPLMPFETLTYRLWDGGLHPACTFLQVSSKGQILILNTVRGDNIGMKQLIDNEVKPLMATRFYKIKEWRDIGDLHLRDKDPSDSTRCPADIIEQELNTYFEDGEMSWERRRETLKEGFNMKVDGEAKIIVNCEDDIMIEALGGGWHYAKNSSGVVINNKPVKDEHSHPGDALSHGLAAILKPSNNFKRNRPERCESFYDPFAEERVSRFQPTYNDFDPLQY